MVTTPLSPPDASVQTERLALARRLLEYWHLLSLDAPTVAVVWSWAFASASGVALHAISAILLGLATWLLYVADRLLDGFSLSQADTLRDRHHFHAFHRIAFLAIALPSLCLLAWLVITRMEPAPRHEDLILAGCALVYLLLVHLPVSRIRKKKIRLFSKEATVAVIFSAACIIPTWSRQSGMHGGLLLAGLPFALLCWLNCVAIETWEIPSPATRDTAKTLSRLCLGLACGSLLLAIVPWTQHKAGLAFLLVCNAASALLLFQLNDKRKWITPLQLRAAADAVLLTPVVFLIVRYLSHRA